MNKDFVPYQIALDMKSIGFDEPCFAYFDAEKVFKFPGTNMCNRNFLDLLTVTAPLYQQAFRWFRERHGLYSEIFVDDNKTFGFLITSFIEEGRLDKPITRQFNTYEEAELAAIVKLIEMVKGGEK